MKYLFLFLLFTASALHAYIPSPDLTQRLDIFTNKLEEIIEEQGSAYGEKIISLLEQRLAIYGDDERGIYILEHVLSILRDTSTPNILLIIADDMGLDATNGYNIGDTKPYTPNLDTLMNSGLRFNNLWSYSVCTPTRSSIITGKYGFRTEMLEVGDELSTSEVSLQSFIEANIPNTYSQAVIGKWHIGNTPDHPKNIGVPHYSGLLSGGVRSYDTWQLVEDGESNTSTDYITSKFSDISIDWLNKQDTPWFLWLTYTSPHTPIHLPPAELHTQDHLSGTAEDIENNPRPYFLAMIESMDTEIGRVLTSLSEEEYNNTIIIFIGDNGTSGSVIESYGKREAKGSIYQGGIHVPMFITGPGVDRIGESEDTPIHTVDLYATIAELAGIDIDSIHDSISFADILSNSYADTREYVYGENINARSGVHEYTIRNNQYKYIDFGGGSTALYDVISDPTEERNLLRNPTEEIERIRDELKVELMRIISSK